MPTMKALHAFTFARRRLRAGERFEAREEHANALRMAYLAVDVVEFKAPASITDEDAARLKDEFEQASVATKVMVVDATPPKRGRGRPKGSYKRRDLVAE